ncbi:MAG: ribonuclease P protein component [Clostridia bacterium]|nr:ribonuclease P protein component [Clostridia bacterium]
MNFGIAIKAKFGKAVKRNRLKRLIKESYRVNEKNFKLGNSIVFLVKKNAVGIVLSFKDIEEDVVKILNKIGQE